MDLFIFKLNNLDKDIWEQVVNNLILTKKIFKIILHI